MHKKFEINRTKIKGSCLSGRKVVTHNSKSDLPLKPEKKPEVRVTKILNLEGLTNAKFGAEMPVDNWLVALDLQSSS